MTSRAITTAYDCRPLVTDCRLPHHEVGAKVWTQKWDVVRRRMATIRGTVVAHDPTKRSLVLLTARGDEFRVECGAVGGAK